MAGGPGNSEDIRELGRLMSTDEYLRRLNTLQPGSQQGQVPADGGDSSPVAGMLL